MAYKTDNNQADIVQALRAAGASVAILAEHGEGIPDLIAGFRGVNYLLEVKNPGGRGNRLTPAQKEFWGAWRGQAAIVQNISEALSALGVEG